MSMSNMCLPHGFRARFHLIKYAICMELWRYLCLCRHACTFGARSNGLWERAEQMEHLPLCFQLSSDLYKWIV